ncbi:MAG: hypothetical protein SGILL_009055, partial [Bacillariaceae sp.]
MTMGKKRKLFDAAESHNKNGTDRSSGNTGGVAREEQQPQLPPPPPIASSSIDEMIKAELSTSVAGRPLPPLPQDYDINNDDKMGSILLFYQYKEPLWTEKEFRDVLKRFLALGERNSITGRGRIATEGVNCTLTGASPQIRKFCDSLRTELDPDLFQNTDFKITDNVPKLQLFKSLSMRKTDELVAYGLAHDKAPSIDKFGGTHLNAVDYHKALQDPNTVVIDV